MTRIKEIARMVPGVVRLHRAMIKFSGEWSLRGADVEDVFTGIFTENGWRGRDSVSGPGSGLHQTMVVRRALPLLIRELKAETILDVPCGDFNWMSAVDLNGVDYIGADVVKGLIEHNTERYARERVRFRQMNIISDKIPRVDLIFCRDCLVHLSFKDIHAALRNICASRSEYLLTTTFTARQKNYDICTGQWRTINLTAAPFNLPSPVRIINEEYTGDGGAFGDKSLGLWRIEDIAVALARHH